MFPIHGYPYTDLHDLNLDWVLKTVKWCHRQVKELAEEISAIRKTHAEDIQRVTADIAKTDAENREWTLARLKELELNLTDVMQRLFMSVTVGYQEADNRIKAWLSVELQNIYNLIPEYYDGVVINPITGDKDTIQNTLNQMASYFSWGALTVEEYAKLNLTVEEYESYHLTVQEYALWAKLYFHKRRRKRLKLGMMADPLTGKWMPVWRVTAWLASLHRAEGITVDEYDNLNLTVNDYNILKLSVYDYDWHAKTLLEP